MEYNLRNIFLQKSCRKEGRENSPLIFPKKAIYQVKANGLHLNFNIFRYSPAWRYNKDKTYETLDC